MGILKTVNKNKVRFLMDYDYNNILGRLKFDLGQDSFFFADIQVRKTDITWSTRSKLEYKPLCEASETEKQAVRKSIEVQKQRISRIIAADTLIGSVVNKITTFPSEQYVFYASYNGDYTIIIAGWGCLSMEQYEENENNIAGMTRNNIVSNKNKTIPIKENVERNKFQANHPKVPDGFFIDNGKTTQKERNKMVKGNKLKSILLVVLAATLALIAPMFLTPITNRLIADVTHQWYLSGGTRVLITFFVTSFTYVLVYFIIKFTALRKSILFNTICIILTFLWCILVGLLFIPD